MTLVTAPRRFSPPTTDYAAETKPEVYITFVIGIGAQVRVSAHPNI
jgi:hypothetical protein